MTDKIAYRQGDGFKSLWAFLVDRRALTDVLFRCQRASGPSKEKLAPLPSVL
jgi:hypothetical protein